MATPHRRAQRTRTPRSSDDAVSDVLGEMLVVAILLGLFAVATVAFLPTDPPVALHADVQTRVECGTGGWGTGDESVVVEHVGGSPLERDRTRVEVIVGDTATDHPLGSLGGPFSDGALVIGERWTDAHTVPADGNVTVRVFYLHADGEVGLWHDQRVETRVCGTG